MLVKNNSRFNKVSALAGLATALITAAATAETGKVCPGGAATVAGTMQSADLDNRFGPVMPPSSPIKFAYVTQLLNDPFWTEVEKGLRNEASRLGVQVEITAPKNRTSTSEQLEVAKAALATKPDVLLLTAIDSTNLKPVIEEANTMGIPTVSINLRSEGVRVHIGTENTSLGEMAAEYLHELFPGGAAVAELEGEPMSPYRIERVKGFADGLNRYENLHLVASLPANWDDAPAKAATFEMMQSHPEIKGIYANSDLMAIGATKALESLNRGDIAVVGTDGVPISKAAIKANKMMGTTAQFPIKEGVLGIQVGLRLLECKPVPNWVISPQVLMNSKSVGDFPAVD